MNRLLFFIVLMWFAIGIHVNVGLAATGTTFAGQIHGLAIEIKKSIETNPLVAGQSLTLGQFVGEGDAKHTNFGQRIELLIKTELGTVLKDKAKLTLAGSYHFVDSDDPTTPNAKILLVTAQIKDARGKQIVPISTEINDTDDIMQVLGLTGSAPHNPKSTFQERNDAAKESLIKPTFDVRDRYKVTAKGLPQWSMGILKKSTFNGRASPVTPDNVDGLAFVPVGIGEFYEIELVNNDKSDAVATLTVDGLDVANTFASDKDAIGNPKHWPGYLVPAGRTFVIRGWLNTIDQKRKDNVFSFSVVELGKGAASQLAGRGGVGVITVQFREACAPNGKLSGRSFGETAKGESLPENLQARPVQIGENVLSTISIRYNRPNRPQ